MNLSEEINSELWKSVEKNYNNENYSGAILDSIHILSDKIREKSGLEGDGCSLVGQAFGIKNPKILINRLQTESEKNIQKGTQDILNGIYTSIRNPRSHDRVKDTKQDADSIILFINYILNIIDVSKNTFQKEKFLERVFDSNYVPDKEYSKLLVRDIPKRERVDIAIDVIRMCKTKDRQNLKYFMDELLSELNDNEIKEVCAIVNEELKYTTEYSLISTLLHIISGKYWRNIERAVLIRIESILIRALNKGEYYEEYGICNDDGELVTLITTEHIKCFGNLDKWSRLLVDKLRTDSKEEFYFVYNYLWDILCEINYSDIEYSFEEFIREALTNNYVAMVDKFKYHIIWERDHPWWGVFENELNEYPEIVFEGMPF